MKKIFENEGNRKIAFMAYGYFIRKDVIIGIEKTFKMSIKIVQFKLLRNGLRNLDL